MGSFPAAFEGGGTQTACTDVDECTVQPCGDVANSCTQTIDGETAHRLSRIDEDFQISRWGKDDEAAQAARSRRCALIDAERLWWLSRAG